MPQATHGLAENQAGRQLLSTSAGMHCWHVQLFFDPWIIACQSPLSMGFPRQDYWSGSPFPSPGDLPNPGIEPESPAWEGGFFTTEPTEKSLKCDCGSFRCSGHRNQKPICDKSPRRASRTQGCKKNKGRAGSCSRMRHKAISYILNLSVDT